MRSTTVQRLAKHFDSFIVEPQYGAIAIKTAEFQHPETNPVRIIIPEHLEQEVIRIYHESPKEGHFATSITTNKVLNRFWLSTPIATVIEYITPCLDCQLKKNSIIHKIKPQRSIMFTIKTNYPTDLLYIDQYGILQDLFGELQSHILGQKL